MRRPLAAVALATFVALSATVRQPEPKPAPSPVAALRISGVGAQTLSLSAADLAALPRTTLSVSEREDQKNTYEGVTVEAILSKAGVAFGQSMRGPRLRDFVLGESPDKYGVVFAIGELADEFSDRRVIVADKVNAAAITGRDGPLRIIVSDEKKHARWVRNVTSLTIKNAGTEEPAAK